MKTTQQAALRTRRHRPWVILLCLATVWLVGSSATTATAAAPAPANAQDSPALETFQGTPVGFTQDGHPFRGDPKAPLTLVEYSDYLCPFCGRYFQQTLPALVEKYAGSGQVQFVFHDFPLASLHPTAPKGHAAAMCVAEQGATPFWKMHDKLLADQQQWARQPDPTAFLAGVAKDIGADMTAYDQCMASDRIATQVQQRVEAGKALGFNGTPSFQFVHHESGKTHTLTGAQPVAVFTQWIESLLAGEEPPQPEKSKPPELPFWAKPEGLAPDPQLPGFTAAGDAYKGNPDAKLVVVEFTDFQCPSCRRHALDTQPELDKRFVDTGEVLWVSKHLPLRMHPQAPAAAAAAECAGKQGQYWAMHHLLFEKMDQWAHDEPDAALVTLAEDLALDKTQFTTCLTSRKALERVLLDLYDAQGIIRSAPTFVLIYDGKGSTLRGARPVDQFVKILEQRLERAKATN